MRLWQFFLLWIILTIFFSLFNNSFILTEVIVQALNSLMYTTGYYISYYYLIRKYLYQKRTWTFVGLYFLLVTVLSFTSMFGTYEVYVYQKRTFYVENYWNELVFYTGNYVLMLLVISTLLGIRILKDRMQTQRLLEEIERQKIITELDFLKAQINPHFLFNSLNNILFQIEKTNKDARETLLKFSDMLRYQLYECTSDAIEIEKEIQYIRNYIEIQMLRKTDRYTCDFSVAPEVRNFVIAPLLLIPFVENAFKYISNHSERNNSIQIKLQYTDGVFTFEVINDKDNISTTNVKENKGIGLSNVKRRLELLYNGKFILNVNDTPDQYFVKLSLTL